MRASRSRELENCYEDVTKTLTGEPQTVEQVKRGPGRPRRTEDYTCVSVTIASDLIQKIDELAKVWGVNRSGAVSRILTAEIDNRRINSPLELENALKRIGEIVKRHV